jgi:hypothetical protein
MESLRKFEWRRNVSGYRLAWLPCRGKEAYWITEADRWWDQKQAVDRTVKLDISTTAYQGEKRIADTGIYIADYRQRAMRGSW